MAKKISSIEALSELIGLSFDEGSTFTAHKVRKAKEKINKLKDDPDFEIDEDVLTRAEAKLGEMEKQCSNDPKNISEHFIDIIDGTRDAHILKKDMTLEEFTSEINDYKQLIPDFFSKNGESKGIRYMYEKVRDPEYSNKTVTSIDLNISQTIYEDYIEGMISFIKDLNECVMEKCSDQKQGNSNNNIDLKKFSDKLKLAKSNDKKFIESIFGGENNSEQEYTIEEATKDLEILIDFIPRMESIHETCNSLKESVDCDNDLVKESLQMLYDSVGNFCYNQVRNVMDTYYSINDLLMDKKYVIETETAYVAF